MSANEVHRLKRSRIADAALDVALDAIVVIDSGGLVVEWNHAAEQIFQWTKHEAVGRAISDLIIPEHFRRAHREGLSRVLETGTGPAIDRRLTLPGVRRDGTQLEVELTISVLEPGDAPMFVGWLRDITELIEARRAVRHAEERRVAMLANVSDIVSLLDRSGRWLSSVGAGTRHLGYDDGLEAAGGLFELVHPDDHGVLQTALTPLPAGEDQRRDPFDLRVMAKDGTWHVLETVAQDLVDDPAVEGFVLTGRDVTEQRARLLETERVTSRLAALAQSLGDGVLFADAERAIVFVNDAFCHLFALGNRPIELIGKPTSSIRAAADALVADPSEFGRTITKRIDRAERTVAEEIALEDGRTLERDYVPVKIPGDEVGHLWLYRDISQRRALEQAQARLVEAERRLREDAETQALAYRSAAELQTEIVAKVSHELRTPLTSIVSLAGQLLDDLASDDSVAADPVELRQFASVITRNADRLGRLVDDLLLLGQLEAGAIRIDRSWHAFDAIVDRALLNVAHLSADGAELTIHSRIQPGPLCWVDAHRIEQVLENLVSNAAKFTAGRGTIEVSAHHRDSAWNVEVRDDGVGIPIGEQAFLFDSFFRASTAGSVPGSGLGLAITRSIVELHGGTITVSSSQGEGATFAFTIPDGDDR